MGHRQSPSSTVASAIRLQRSVALCTVPPTPFFGEKNEMVYCLVCVLCRFGNYHVGFNHLGGGSFHFQVLVGFPVHWG